MSDILKQLKFKVILTALLLLVVITSLFLFKTISDHENSFQDLFYQKTTLVASNLAVPLKVRSINSVNEVSSNSFDDSYTFVSVMNLEKEELYQRGSKVGNVIVHPIKYNEGVVGYIHYSYTSPINYIGQIVLPLLLMITIILIFILFIYSLINRNTESFVKFYNSLDRINVKEPRYRPHEDLQGLDSNFMNLGNKISALIKELNHSNIMKQKHEAQKNKFKIARQVAHDVRAPLSILNDNKEKIVSTIPDSGNAIGRLNEIINDLLGSKTEEIELPIITTINEVLNEKNSSAINFSSDLSQDESKYFFNHQRFKRLLSNLINNSIEAEATALEIELTQTEKELVLKLKDNGKGIPKHILHQLGEIEISHGKEGGNGIGLLDAFKYIKSVGGELKVSSTEGEGTAIEVLLPKQRQGVFSSISQIIHIEDDKYIRKSWELQSKKAGIQYIGFESFVEFEKECSLSNEEQKETHFFIDQNLEYDERNGVELSENLKYFKYIIITSGEDIDTKQYPWITTSIGKEYPIKS